MLILKENEYLITQVKHEGTNPQELDEGAQSQGRHYINYTLHESFLGFVVGVLHHSHLLI
ncbi:hypothetical protein [Zooshikella ganghwensis]|uniref:hypothetical protein n=1 Tax=Zooshikella ganghwensis TaxID=202772 RepID=UPI0003F69126|nr:hypothetical protein [Zooshikella ganghwensis]